MNGCTSMAWPIASHKPSLLYGLHSWAVTFFDWLPHSSNPLFPGVSPALSDFFTQLHSLSIQNQLPGFQGLPLSLSGSLHKPTTLTFCMLVKLASYRELQGLQSAATLARPCWNHGCSSLSLLRLLNTVKWIPKSQFSRKHFSSRDSRDSLLERNVMGPGI